jgi:ribosome maturation factor RimP
MNNVLENGYILEVSSPGVDRVLRKEKDFLKFKASRVKIKLKKPVNNARVYYGELLGFENGAVILSGGLKFNLSDIDEARLHPGDDDILKKH